MRTKVAKIARDLNVGCSDIFDLLREKKIEIEEEPNARVDEETARMLELEIKRRQCPKCGVVSQSRNVHYCGACGAAISGAWELYDASVYDVVEQSKPDPVASVDIEALQREANELSAKLMREKASTNALQINVDKEIRKLTLERNALKRRFGNRIVESFARHLEYLDEHAWAYHLEGLAISIVLLLVPFLVLFLR